jgi:hypothetical protein
VVEPNETTCKSLCLLNDLTTTVDGSNYHHVGRQDRFLLPRLGLANPSPVAFRRDDDSSSDDLLFGSLCGGQNAQMPSQQQLVKKFYKTPKQEGTTTFMGCQDVAKGLAPLDPLDDGGIPDASCESEAYQAKGQAFVSSAEARSIFARSQGSNIMEPRSIEDMMADTALPMVPAEDLLTIWPLPIFSGL